MQLTLVYIPTNYGIVDPTLVTGAEISDDQSQIRPALTAADIASERAESEAANQQRIDDELAKMRERIERLERELKREQQR